MDYKICEKNVPTYSTIVKNFQKFGSVVKRKTKRFEPAEKLNQAKICIEKCIENFVKRLDLVISAEGGHIQDKIKLFFFKQKNVFTLKQTDAHYSALRSFFVN